MGSARVRDVMTRYVAVVRPKTSFKTLTRLMIDLRVSALPVIGDDNRVVGVVSEADLLRKLARVGIDASSGSPWWHRSHSAHADVPGNTAGDVMSTPVRSVDPDATLPEAARLMETAGVKRLLVIAADGGLRGLLSRRDVLSRFDRPDHDIASDIRRNVVDKFLTEDGVTVQVCVTNGVARLTGHVDRRSSAEIARRMTLAVDGVVDVLVDLTWGRDDTEEIHRRHVFEATI